MLALKPITKQEYDLAIIRQEIKDSLATFEVPTNGRDGKDGANGVDGVTTLVTKEVLASKEKRLTKEEFEKFKKMMLQMEQDVRQSIAQSFNIGGGGMADLVNVIEVDASTTISGRQLKKNQFDLIRRHEEAHLNYFAS